MPSWSHLPPLLLASPGAVLGLPWRKARAVVRRQRHRWIEPPRPESFAALGLEGLLGEAGRAAVWCSPGRRASVLESLGAAERDAVRARAAAILRGELTVFGHPLRIGPEASVPWGLDPLSGHRWETVAVEQLARSVPGADVKYPWALGRLDEALALAQGAWCAGDEDERAACVRRCLAWIDDFLQANPIGRGVQWACAMEVSLRAANLAQVIHLLADRPELAEPQRVVAAGRRTRSPPGLGRGPPGGRRRGPQQPPRCRSGRRAGRRPRCSPGCRRLRADGPGRARGCSRNSTPRSTRTGSPSRAASPTTAWPWSSSRWPSAWTRRAVPGGQRDRGCGCSGCSTSRRRSARSRGLPRRWVTTTRAARCRSLPRAPLDFSYLAPLGAALFSDAGLKAPDAILPPEAAWLLGREGAHTLRRLSASFAPATPELHAGRTARAPRGRGPGRGQRGHARAARRRRAQPPGSALLRAPRGWASPASSTAAPPRTPASPSLRNRMRGTEMHNTVELDGEEQSPLARERLFALPWLWRRARRGPADRPRPGPPGGRRTRAIADSRPRWWCVARCVLDKVQRALAIEDVLEGGGLHEACWRLHLADRGARLEQAPAEVLQRARLVPTAPQRFGVARRCRWRARRAGGSGCCSRRARCPAWSPRSTRRATAWRVQSVRVTWRCAGGAAREVEMVGAVGDDDRGRRGGDVRRPGEDTQMRKMVSPLLEQNPHAGGEGGRGGAGLRGSAAGHGLRRRRVPGHRARRRPAQGHGDHRRARATSSTSPRSRCAA